MTEIQYRCTHLFPPVCLLLGKLLHAGGQTGLHSSIAIFTIISIILHLFPSASLLPGKLLGQKLLHAVGEGEGETKVAAI